MYENDYFYPTLLLYPDDSKLISPSGRVYTCSSDIQNDLMNYDNLSSNYLASFAFSSDGNGIIALQSDYYYNYPNNLTIYSKDNYDILGYVENFFNVPEHIVVNGDDIKLISQYNYGIIAEVLSYSDLISGGGKMLGKPVKEKFYFPKKLK